jgi:hypothetical protein
VTARHGVGDTGAGGRRVAQEPRETLKDDPSVKVLPVTVATAWVVGAIRTAQRL